MRAICPTTLTSISENPTLNIHGLSALTTATGCALAHELSSYGLLDPRLIVRPFPHIMLPEAPNETDVV
jgi:hypothetical protein